MTSCHLWENDHVTEVGLDAVWLLLGGGVNTLLGSPQTLEECVVLALETVLETARGKHENTSCISKTFPSEPLQRHATIQVQAREPERLGQQP